MTAKKDDKHEARERPESGVVSRSITTEMRESYLAYAMSVIVSRALPDARDGLKPVHRRILYTMNKLGLGAGGKTRKSATVVGEVMGKLHPHGDAAIYDALAKLTQDFSMRYPLIIGQGNFGCFTKDTKVRLADGRNISFEELIAEDAQGKKNYTFTVSVEGKVAMSPIVKPRLTKRAAEIMKVVLDTGEGIRCTLNHKFLLKNQTYVEAQDLKPGMSLMPLYTRYSENGDSPLADMKGYEMVLQPLTKEWEFAHHLADAHNIERGAYTLSDGRVRHHVDFNKLNNSPDNIKRMHWLEHWHLHSKLTKERHTNDSAYVEKLAEGRKAFWAQKENRAAYSKRMTLRNKDNWQDKTYREEKSVFLSEVNKAYIEAHPERRKELSTRLTGTLKRLWQDPTYRQVMRSNIIKGNKNHTHNQTGKKKFDAVCARVLAGGSALSEKVFEEARLQVYPYGHATTWQTGLQKYYGC